MKIYNKFRVVQWLRPFNIALFQDYYQLNSTADSEVRGLDHSGDIMGLN
jgi:hypothetical protein